MAIVVPNGPADRLGSVKPGDVIEMVNGVACTSVADVIGVLSSPEVHSQ